MVGLSPPQAPKRGFPVTAPQGRLSGPCNRRAVRLDPVGDIALPPHSSGDVLFFASRASAPIAWCLPRWREPLLPFFRDFQRKLRPGRFVQRSKP
jgi:hypothetical protein